jgi:hypothetical protein
MSNATPPEDFGARVGGYAFGGQAWPIVWGVLGIIPLVIGVGLTMETRSMAGQALIMLVLGGVPVALAVVRVVNAVTIDIHERGICARTLLRREWIGAQDILRIGECEVWESGGPRTMGHHVTACKLEFANRPPLVVRFRTHRDQVAIASVIPTRDTPLSKRIYEPDPPRLASHLHEAPRDDVAPESAGRAIESASPAAPVDQRFGDD